LGGTVLYRLKTMLSVGRELGTLAYALSHFIVTMQKIPTGYKPVASLTPSSDLFLMEIESVATHKSTAN
jgi:hypothetical protein